MADYKTQTPSNSTGLELKSKDMTQSTYQTKTDDFLARIPQLYRNAYKRALTGNSLRARVNSKCLECCSFERVAVSKCDIVTCSLNKVRPYQREDKVRDE